MSNIAFLIGNGFDLNVGMKTSYKHFYVYYNKRASSHPAIARLKENIKAYYKGKPIDKINWSDLELALGQYCKEFPDKAIFDIVFRDIVQCLSDYLKIEEKRFWEYKSKSNANNQIYIYLRSIDSFIPAHLVEKISGALSSDDILDITLLTFNYTRILEDMLGWNGVSLQLGSSKWGRDRSAILNDIQHVHGYVDSRLVLGVNDKSQVNNDTLLSAPYFKNAFIKSQCNLAQGTDHVQKCEQYIADANVICAFGLSIGATDKVWWQHIGRQILQRDVPFVIFAHSNRDVNGIFGYDRLEVSDTYINAFLSNINVTNEEKEKIRKNIYVVVNSNIFKFKF